MKINGITIALPFPQRNVTRDNWDMFIWELLHGDFGKREFGYIQSIINGWSYDEALELGYIEAYYCGFHATIEEVNNNALEVLKDYHIIWMANRYVAPKPDVLHIETSKFKLDLLVK